MGATRRPTRPLDSEHSPNYSRSAATQSYRTTTHAQRIARRLTVLDDGHRITLRPLAAVLSPKTRATLAALARRRNGGRTNGR